MLVVVCTSAYAQYTQIGTGAGTNARYGPIMTDTVPSAYSRTAYIWPQATLTNLVHGDTISAFSFKHQNFDTMRGSCKMKIYVKSTSVSDFGIGPLNWLAESRNGMTLVYEDDIKSQIKAEPGYALFEFNKTKYRFDTTGKAVNLQVLVEYTQNTNQDAVLPWKFETNATVTGFFSGNEGKFLAGTSTSGMDSMTTYNSIFKPTLRIHHPRVSDELELSKLYSLGKVPLLMDRPDSIKVAVFNVGKETITNRKVYLRVGGANKFKDTITITSIDPYENTFAYFTRYEPTKLGNDSLIVTLGDDDDSSNNEAVKVVEVNYNEYSHADPFLGSSGGIGFSGETGDFVAKFYVEGNSYINQIKVDFSTRGLPFRLGVWDDDGRDGLPGTELFMSTISRASTSTFIMPVLPRIQVSGGYYVGIRQASDTNVGFSFQYEQPIRPSTFYFAAPAGDSSWVPFAPGFDFNFNIQPRLQVANDLGVLNIESPGENDSIQYSETDSIDLKAKIINYGYQNQGSFLAKYEVFNRFNQRIFTSSKLLSLDADDTSTVEFGKLSRYHLGKLRATASVSLSTDSVTDNNEQSIDFYIVKDNDVAVDRYYSLSPGDSFDLNREYFSPTFRVINYGVKNQYNFRVAGELVASNGEVFSRQEKLISLEPEFSQIISMDSIVLPQEGYMTYRAFTMLQNDSFPQNDTLSINLYGKKIDDLEIVEIRKPKHLEKYAKGSKMFPLAEFRNDGRTNQDSGVFYATIYGVDSVILYSDTIIKGSSFFSNGQVLFKEFNTDTVGEFTCQVEVFIPDDQKEDNDIKTSNFSLVTPNDIQLVGLYKPMPVTKVGTPAENLMLIVRNNGFNDASDVPISIRVVDNSNNVLLSDTVDVSISSFSSDTVAFGSLTFNTLGDYYVSGINHWSLEDEPNRMDTLNTTYVTRYELDGALYNHIAIPNGDTIELNEKVYPQVSVTNLGLDSLINLQIEVSIENQQGIVHFIDTLVSASLGPNRGTSLTSLDSFVAVDAGSYLMNSRILTKDDFVSNNNLQSSFEVALRQDAELLVGSYPDQGSNLYSKQKHKPSVEIVNNGISDLENVAVNCKVYVDGLMIYEDTRFVDLISQQKARVGLDSNLTYENLVDAQAVFICSTPDDQIRMNDTLEIDFKFAQGLGVSIASNIKVNVYPNPFTEELVIESEQVILSVRVLDLLGKEVYTIDKQNVNRIKIPTHFSSGSYIVEIVNEDGVISVPVVKR